MILVVGATGQLGTAVIRRLVANGQSVRAFVRHGSRHEHLRAMGAELAFGDLRESDAVDAACRDVHTVMATANVVAPEGPSSFEAVEGRGYAALISACERHAVAQFIFASVPVTPHDDAVPTFRYKRLNEQRLQQSRLTYTVFQCSLFMDDWFAFIGSRIPLHGAESATLDRRYWFLQAFMKGVGGLIDRRGIALIPGSPRVRHAFIALDDVAEFMVRSIGREDLRRAVVQIGGPQVLTWGEVVACYSAMLGKPLRAIYLPSGLFRVQRALLAPLSEPASNIMGLNWLVGFDTLYDSSALAATLGIRLTSTEQFLRDKAGLPAA
ncbi:MAG: NmrA family NAD(P)-binding protein [Steroidobacteraceae bacterium]